MSSDLTAAPAARSRVAVAALPLLLTCLGLTPAPSSDVDLFTESVAALERGAPTDAIDALELLADRGFVHPDASYNRGVAYLQRGTGSHARPGDLGKAVAALEETLLLRPGDAQVARALEAIREEIARRRAIGGSSPMVVRPSLLRAVVGLASEDGWALAALIGSAAVSIGLMARLWLGATSARVAGNVLWGVGLCATVVTASLAGAARYIRTMGRPAVVISAEARLLDERGLPAARPARRDAESSLPEVAAVEISERAGRLARVRWGETEGWVLASQLRLLERPGGAGR